MSRAKKTMIGLAVTAGMLLLQALGIPFLTQIDDKLTDIKFRLRGPAEPTSPIVLVCIDQKSIDRVGRWPWRRSRIAELVRAISGARPRVIALDFVFSEPSYDPGNDADLAAAIGSAGNVVLGAIFYFSPLRGPALSRARRICGR